jgi:hypothetical protein
MCNIKREGFQCKNQQKFKQIGLFLCEQFSILNWDFEDVQVELPNVVKWVSVKTVYDGSLIL